MCMAGSEIALKDTFGRSAAMCALDSYHANIYQLLDPEGSEMKRQQLRNMELWRFAEEGDTEQMEAVLSSGADVNAADRGGSCALHYAVRNRQAEAARRLLAAGADVNVVPQDQLSALMLAAIRGDEELTRLLLAANADASFRGGYNDRTAAELALDNAHPMVYALIDRVGAEVKGAALKREFTEAKLVHVLSTRYMMDPSQKGVEGACDPKTAAATVKRVLEADPLVLSRKWGFIDDEKTSFPGTVKVFDPNADNAFLMDGDPTQANAIWLLNWRQVGLENARRTGGSCIQVLVPPGPSPMQIAEASMANDRGVPVVRIDCSQTSIAIDVDAAEQREVRALREQMEKVKNGEAMHVPPTREELDSQLEEARRISARNVVLS